MKYTPLAFLCLIYIQSFAQKIHNSQIDRFQIGFANSSEHRIILEMPFGKANVQKIKGDTNLLKRIGQVTIDIVFTDYGQGVVLQDLNQRRLQQVFSLFPTITKNMVSDINYYRQLDNGNKQLAQEMFHGVLIRFRPPQDKETVKADLKRLDELLVSSKGNPLKKVYGDTSTKKKMQEKTTTKERSTTMDRPASAFKDATGISLEGGQAKLFYGELLDDSLGKGDTFGKYSDSTVFKVFQRNQWKNYAIVGDVTGSMYPYTAQLLIWLKLQSIIQLTRNYSFFNDGDNKRDNEKQIGSTGGIYSKECTNYEEVEELIKSTMQKGGGGDAPENNIEALIKAEELYPNIDYAVMLADNWAPIKDLTLADRLTKPVRIIVCGAINYNVRVDYLNLARKTKGSIHTIEDDITQLAELNEGETIQFGKRHYQIQNGKFVEVLSL